LFGVGGRNHALRTLAILKSGVLDVSTAETFGEGIQEQMPVFVAHFLVGVEAKAGVKDFARDE
jgi:hypothetical protein